MQTAPLVWKPYIATLLGDYRQLIQLHGNGQSDEEYLGIQIG